MNKMINFFSFLLVLLMLSACGEVSSQADSSLSASVPQNNTNSSSSKEEKPNIESRAAQYKNAEEQNTATAAWLYLPAVSIDTPVMQTNNNTDYLRTHIGGYYDVWGTPFIDYRCQENLQGKNILLYGHGSNKGNGFSVLEKYLEQSFYEESPYLQITTDKGDAIYKIFAVFKTALAGEDIFDYTQTDFMSDSDFQTFIDGAIAKSETEPLSLPSARNNILTIQTCAYDFAGEKLVVMCYTL